MGFDMRAHPLLLVVAAAGAVTAAGCTNLLTGDQATLDEFAQFKATGGRCEQGGTEPVTVDALADATGYRFRLFDGVLTDVISPLGRVYYDSYLQDPELLVSGQRIVEEMASLDVAKFTGYEAQLAFWLNAYNASVLVAAAQAYAADPMFRVDNNSFAFFDQRVHDVGGTLYSLNEIEHGLIRGDGDHPAVFFLPDEDKAALFALHDQMQGERPLDVRVHFALNCASTSCPPLFPDAYKGETLDDVLESATFAFLNDDEKGAGPDGISQIFDFYIRDFENLDGGIEGFIAQYRDIDEVDVFSLLPYDWSLNRAAP